MGDGHWIPPNFSLLCTSLISSLSTGSLGEDTGLRSTVMGSQGWFETETYLEVCVGKILLIEWFEGGLRAETGGRRI